MPTRDWHHAYSYTVRRRNTTNYTVIPKLERPRRYLWRHNQTVIVPIEPLTYEKREKTATGIFNGSQKIQSSILVELYLSVDRSLLHLHTTWDTTNVSEHLPNWWICQILASPVVDIKRLASSLGVGN